MQVRLGRSKEEVEVEATWSSAFEAKAEPGSPNSRVPPKQPSLLPPRYKVSSQLFCVLTIESPAT